MSGITVGVVGAGSISRFHFMAFAETGTRVRIIADPKQENAAPYQAKFGADYADSHEAVVTHPDVDAVVVTAPSRFHYPVAKAALENGKHVICEKTLTLSPADSYELGQLAESRGRLLFTSYMKRFFPAVQKAKELMPALGHVMSVYCRTYQGGNHDCHTGAIGASFATGADGQSPIMKMSGGGILVCGGSHIFDLLLHLVGKPSAVYGRGFYREGSDVDLMFHALLDLPAGGEVHFEGNWHPLRKVGYENRGWDEGFEINGVNGRLVLQTPVWNQPEHNAATLRHYDNTAGHWTEYAFDIVNPFVEAEKYFLTQIGKGEQGGFDPYVGYRTDLLLATAKASHDQGTRLGLDWKA